MHLLVLREHALQIAPRFLDVRLQLEATVSFLRIQLKIGIDRNLQGIRITWQYVGRVLENKGVGLAEIERLKNSVHGKHFVSK